MYKPLYYRRWKWFYTIIGDDNTITQVHMAKLNHSWKYIKLSKDIDCGPPFSLYNVKMTTMERAAFQLEL